MQISTVHVLAQRYRLNEVAMKESWVKLKEWWSSLAIRERQALMLLSGFLSIFLIYACVWSPLYNAANTKRNRITADQKILDWMVTADKEIQQLEHESHGTGKTVSPVVLLGVLQKQINHAELEQQLVQLKQINNDSVEMHFQKVAFDKVITLLSDLIKEENVTITQMSATAEKAPGLVDVDVTLRIEM